MKIRRLMIGAPKSGSGKTIMTCALLQALKDKGQQVISYKCGPDYIDPMFHEKVIGISSKNLDTFFTEEEETKRLFLNSAVEGGFAVLEGVMGLFDGLGGIKEEGSSYHLAKVTKTPIILVVDVKGMGRSMIPLLLGFLSYDKENLIQGVLLNRISKGYYEIVKPYIEKELKITVLGFLPERREFHIESRHLGLVMPEELNNMKETLQLVSKEFLKTVSIESIMELGTQAEKLEWTSKAEVVEKEENYTSFFLKKDICRREKPVIAVAKDEAFCFYYIDNILMLEENGAEIKYFSPIYDKKLPDGCQGLLLGGGYPELYGEKLSKNRQMCAAVREAAERGMPVVAECGGFMYLHSSIIDKEGNCYHMAGVIPSTCFYTGKLVRFGYIEIQERKRYFLPEGEKIKGHEYHYFDSDCQGEDAIAMKPVSGRTYSCIIEDEKRWMGFPHLYYPSNPAFAKEFVKKAEEYKV